MKRLFAWGAAVLLTGFRLSAGIVLPDATYSIGLTSDSASVGKDSPGNYALGRATVSVQGLPNLAIYASSYSSKDYDIGAGAGATVTYSFTVLGAADYEIIPLQISGNLWARATQEDGSNASGHAQLSVRTAIDGTGVDVRASAGGPSYASWSDTLHFNYMGGYDNVGMNVVTLVVDAGENVGSDEAYGDPYITFDPSFVNPGGYSIQVSEGIGNSPLATVPEPQSLGLIGLGLCGLGFLRRYVR